MSRRRRLSKKVVVVIVIVAVVMIGAICWVASQSGGDRPVPAASTAPAPGSTDDQLRQLFNTQQSNVEVSGTGTVIRLLADDDEGGRHQRFILQLASGQTLLIAHNIDIAPRLDGLAVGDTVSFKGEYIYSDQGGTIHWTHHDPDGTHAAGWLQWNGQQYS